MHLETKFCRFEADVTVADGARIEGYASLFGAQDNGNDVVARGAYAASLKRLGAEGRGVKMLWQHDPAAPIGVWDEVREDGRGLFVKGRILDSIAKGREAAALVAAGAIDGLSIGYRTIRATKTDGGQRLLTELELWEVSLVTFPMLSSARVQAKGDESPEAGALREMAQALEAARLDLRDG
ncbi:HK97 family phage prohead protease [Roseivivax marinus]|jgi:HK97 family phage prohead protease|uniref:HK97 family phage prohead protease n=1 Tax=Roseivivax marinus TaxID=1379903 RepID=UPI00274010FC|nr:HK97 family phage prohead protease [Roseivivax marinus]